MCAKIEAAAGMAWHRLPVSAERKERRFEIGACLERVLASIALRSPDSVCPKHPNMFVPVKIRVLLSIRHGIRILCPRVSPVVGPARAGCELVRRLSVSQR
jgi:hypothetical protein